MSETEPSRRAFKSGVWPGPEKAGPLPPPGVAEPDRRRPVRRRNELEASYRLASVTPPAWADAVAAQPVELLSDHAHCELKAAASAMTLLKRNADRPGLAGKLAPLIREETDHLHLVLRSLHSYGGSLGQDEVNPYTEGLLRYARDTRRDGPAYLDHLLVSALIEKRSHERFRRLRQCRKLARIRRMYTVLCEAEERHGDLFMSLALQMYPGQYVRDRYDGLQRQEALLLAGLPFGPRVHSGLDGLPTA